MSVHSTNIEIAFTRDNADTVNIGQWKVVKWYDADSIKLATAGDTPFAIFKKPANQPEFDAIRVHDGTITAGDIPKVSLTPSRTGTFIRRGFCYGVLGTGDSVTAGQAIMLSDVNSGCITNWKPGHQKIGMALETSSTAGAEVEIYANFNQENQENFDYQELTADGAITIDHGYLHLNKAGVIAATLANPVRAGNRIVIRAMTAKAHTVALSATPGLDGAGASGDLLTFGGAINDAITLYSIDVSGTLRWCQEPGTNVNVTVS